MKIPEHLTLAVDRWFSENTGLGGCSDKDVAELAGIFYEVHFDGGRESVDDALAVVESFGPGIAGLNDTYARQVLLAQEIKALRAEPTEEMVLAGMRRMFADRQYTAPWEDVIRNIYNDMRAAATSVPEAGGLEK